MRALLPLALLAALASPSLAAGGLVVGGAGLGTFATSDGAAVCPGSPFAAQVAYLPDGHGALVTEFVGSCLGRAGGTAIAGQVAVNGTASPPVRITYYCVGTEAAGLACEGTVGGTTITAQVGPYAGPGGMVTLSTRGSYRFDGAFLAA